MSRDQRVEDNHALLYAQQRALQERLPLIVGFNIHNKTGVRGYEHYAFMLDGLMEVAKHLEELSIPFVLTHGKTAASYVSLIKQLDPSAVYFDFSPLKGPRSVAEMIALSYPGSTYIVDTHNIIPTWITSQKLEFAAHTIRKKIHTHLANYLVEPGAISNHIYHYDQKLPSISFAQARTIISALPRRGIKPGLNSGAEAAHIQLQTFITRGLKTYAKDRNNITTAGQSGLSPYLHFGQLSSLRVALEIMYAVNKRPLLYDSYKMAHSSETPNSEDGMNALFEEMIVRKELSDNFCLHADSYTNLEGAYDWARNTLTAHINDTRPHIYNRKQLESAQTEDAAWNAAQLQMVKTGKMHGYMRMYWAKKILEWSPDAQTALDHAIYLNDAYSIDGGDPNGYTGIMWSMAGVHDRPWSEREVFGKIRYMNYAGLKRKFDIETYIKQWTR